jgi:hypothetical protein
VSKPPSRPVRLWEQPADRIANLKETTVAIGISAPECTSTIYLEISWRKIGIFRNQNKCCHLYSRLPAGGKAYGLSLSLSSR